MSYAVGDELVGYKSSYGHVEPRKKAEWLSDIEIIAIGLLRASRWCCFHLAGTLQFVYQQQVEQHDGPILLLQTV